MSRGRPANAKKNNKPDQQDEFQKPVGTLLARRRSSLSNVNTSCSQRANSEASYTPTGTTHLSRKQSHEMATVQIQLANRQMEEVKKLIDDNNTSMEGRIERMISKGENSMLSRLEEILTVRDQALENRLLKHIQDGEQKLSYHLNQRLELNEMTMETKIKGSIAECQLKMQTEIIENANATISKINGKIERMDEANQTFSDRLNKRFVDFTQKQELHQSELLQGLSQIEEMKTRVTNSARRVDEVNRKVDDRFDSMAEKFEIYRGLVDGKLNIIMPDCRA